MMSEAVSLKATAGSCGLFGLTMEACKCNEPEDAHGAPQQVLFQKSQAGFTVKVKNVCVVKCCVGAYS